MARADNLWACEDWAPPAPQPLAPRCASSSAAVLSVCAPLQLCVPLTLSLRRAARLEHVPPRSPPSPRLRPRSGSCLASNSASKAAPPSLRQSNRRVLEDLPRLLDCVNQVFWRLTCVRRSMIPVKASKVFTRHTLTCGTGTTGSGASCMSIARPVWACITSCCACSIFCWAFCSVCVASSPDSTAREIWRALGPSSVPRSELSSSPPPPSATRFPRCGFMLWASRMLLPVPTAAGQCKSLGCPFRLVHWVSSISGGSSTLWPSHGL